MAEDLLFEILVWAISLSVLTLAVVVGSMQVDRRDLWQTGMAVYALLALAVAVARYAQ